MQNLLFLTGRIRSKEKDLLGREIWQRFAEATDFNDWQNKLKETSYAGAAEKIDTFEQLETSLNVHLQELKTDLFATQQFGFEPLLWKKYDFHNFKVLLKMKERHKDLKKYLVPLGQIPLEILEAFLVGNEKVSIPLEMRVFLRQAAQVYEKTGDFSAMDRYLDQEYFKQLYAAAGSFGHAAVEYVQFQIAAANFRLWWYVQKNPERKSELAYFENAKFTPEQLLAKVFPGVSISALKEEAFVHKEIENFISRSIFKKRYNLWGILPILIFFRAKEIEIKNLKIYYLKQTKNLTKLAEFLQETYV